MGKSQKEELLVKELTKMFVVTGDEATPDKILAYVEYLRDYATEHGSSFEDVIKAIKKAGMEISYTPKVSDIIEHLKKSEQVTDSEINDMANYAFKTYQHKMLEGRGETPKFDHESLQIAFEATLLENNWLDDSEQFSRFFRASIKRNLRNILTAPENQSRLALQEAQEKKERAALYE